MIILIFLAQMTKPLKMRVAVAFFVLISSAMAFKLQEEDPNLPNPEELDDDLAPSSDEKVM